MTREEAIKVLRTESIELGGSVPSVCRFWEALDMAIAALRQQETVTNRNGLIADDLVPEMTLDDAIAHLDNTLSDTGRKWSCESCRQEHVQLRSWLAELREIKQNRNEPMTLDELRKMDGEPVWVVCLEPERYYEPPIGWRIIEKSIVGTFGVWNDSSCLAERDYGKTWLAYRQKPEEIQK